LTLPAGVNLPKPVSKFSLNTLVAAFAGAAAIADIAKTAAPKIIFFMTLPRYY
jgi:hypothetical protein